MSHVSIRARLIFLSVLLLVILAVSSALLIRELMRHSQSLAEQARLVSIVRTATTASKHFGDLKYWLTDLAITQLTRSQQNAADAKARLDADLKAIAAVHPEGVAAIGREVETLTDLARRAGEAYSGDDSVEGNALLAQARSRILNIDDEIDKIVARVEQQALAGRDASARQAERVVGARDHRRHGCPGGRARPDRLYRALDHRSAKEAGRKHGGDYARRARRRDTAGKCP